MCIPMTPALQGMEREHGWGLLDPSLAPGSVKGLLSGLHVCVGVHTHTHTHTHTHAHSMHIRFCMAQSLPYKNLQILEQLRSSLKATAKEEGLVYRTKCKQALHFSHTVQHRNGVSQEERDTVNRRKMSTFAKG